MESIMSETIGQKLTKQFEMFEVQEVIYSKDDGRKCIHCSKVKSPDSYEWRDGQKKSRRKDCRVCRNLFTRIVRELYSDNPKPNSPDYECPCCFKTEKQIRETRGHYTDRTIWVLDHNHITQKFRGWICDHCNVGLGRFDDKIENLTKAITYLERDNE